MKEQLRHIVPDERLWWGVDVREDYLNDTMILANKVSNLQFCIPGHMIRERYRWAEAEMIIRACLERLHDAAFITERVDSPERDDELSRAFDALTFNPPESDEESKEDELQLSFDILTFGS